MPRWVAIAASMAISLAIFSSTRSASADSDLATHGNGLLPLSPEEFARLPRDSHLSRLSSRAGRLTLLSR